MLSWYFNTIRYLTWRQILARLWFRVYRPSPDTAPAPRHRKVTGEWLPPICGKGSLRGRWCFEFLNEIHDLSFPGDWNPSGIPRLWVYNLHYFDDLKACNGADRIGLHKDLLIRWVEDNPPPSGAGWEPYPTSLRIVNWIKWALAGNGLPPAVDHSLAVQARWLLRRLEYHLLGNHLLANAKALIFAGSYFDGIEADTWRQKGERILEDQLPMQILPDGGHYERSPMYHLLVLEDLLDLVNMYNRYQLEVPGYWRDVIERMLSWSGFMRHQDGEIPFFNDAVFGVAPPPEKLDRYAKSLGFHVGGADKNGCLADSGYCRIVQGNTVIFVDCGPVGPDCQPGHAHADTLSFEASVQGRRVFVNTGISTYERGEKRGYERGSAAHNTLVIDGLDSSEVWAAFRVARRARIRKLETRFRGGTSFVLAEHDGYKRLSDPILHERTWQLDNVCLEIVDRVSGRGQHLIELYFHLHPDVSVQEASKIIHISWKDSGDGIANLHPDANVDVSIDRYSYHPEFGMSIPAHRIILRTMANLPCALKTRIEWL